MLDRVISSFETLMGPGRKVSPCAIDSPLRLTWIAPKDPFEEADGLREKRLSSVYGLAAWEVDYIKELLSHLDVRYAWTNDPGKLPESHIVVYSRNHFKRGQIRRGLLMARPRMVVHLSDEWGKDGPWHAFLKDYPLVLRQHQFDHYQQHENIKTIPLGYMQGMFDGSTVGIGDLETRPRHYAWSFIGDIKGRREEALNTFRSIEVNRVGSAHPSEMARIYKDSKFVVCPAGNVNILCFRNFEASICGAIPVIAGCSTEKYREATRPLGNPPWIFHETWEDAKRELQSLLADESALRERRKAVIDWWRDEIMKVRTYIDAVLT